MKIIISTVVIITILLGCSKKEGIDDNIPTFAEEYFTWVINGMKDTLMSPIDSIASGRYATTTEIAAEEVTFNKGVTLRFTSGRSPGTYPINTFTLLTNGVSYYRGSLPLQIHVTKYGQTGDFITGSYHGSILNLTDTFSIKGIFKIRTR